MSNPIYYTCDICGGISNGLPLGAKKIGREVEHKGQKLNIYASALPAPNGGKPLSVCPACLTKLVAQAVSRSY
jgi:hypothetical protein